MRKRKHSVTKGCLPTINDNEDCMAQYRWTCTACGRTWLLENLTDARAAHERRIAKTGIYRCRNVKCKSNRHLRLAKVR